MIDVIIPAYNSHETIEYTLMSIAMQNIVKKLNVYIIDDNSKSNYITTNLKLNLDASRNASNSNWNDLSGNDLNGKVNGAIYKIIIILKDLIVI